MSSPKQSKEDSSASGDIQEFEFLRKSICADIQLEVEGKLLYVSRSFLTTISPVFRLMFESDFKERNVDVLPLPGKKYEDVLTFLRCTNQGVSVKINYANVYGVFPLAHEYQVQRLLEECKNCLRQELWLPISTFDNNCRDMNTTLRILRYCEICVLAENYDLEDLLEICVENFTKINAKWYKNLPMFQKISTKLRNRIFCGRLDVTEIAVRTQRPVGMKSRPSSYIDIVPNGSILHSVPSRLEKQTLFGSTEQTKFRHSRPSGKVSPRLSHSQTQEKSANYFAFGNHMISLVNPNKVSNDGKDNEPKDDSSDGEDIPEIEFLRKSSWTDIKLEVESKRLYVARSFLATISPVFRQMFESDFKEKNIDVLPLPGKKYDDVLAFLRCTSQRVLDKVNNANVSGVLPLALEYQVQRLLDECKQCLLNQLLSIPTHTFDSNVNDTNDNTKIIKCCEVCFLAEKYDLEDLLEICVEKFTNVNAKWYKNLLMFQKLSTELQNRIFCSRLHVVEKVVT